MPIRINLLAEAQALEDLRRRDPVKRAILGSVVAVLLVLAYSSSLQLKAMIGKGEVGSIEAQLAARTNEYKIVQESQKRLNDVNRRITSLQQLATNRLLHGTLLDALQKTASPDVQVVRLKTEQHFILNEEVKAKTNANNRITPGAPASVTEKMVLTLEARDTSATAGDQVNAYKQGLSESPYFKTALGGTNDVRLASLSPPTGGSDGKPFVLFTLECRYPEKTR